MTYSKPARTTTRPIPRAVAAGLLVVVAAIATVHGYQALASSSSAAEAIWPNAASGQPEHRGALCEADGAVPDGVTVFDDGYPAVANLDPALLRALHRAPTDAAGRGAPWYGD